MPLHTWFALFFTCIMISISPGAACLTAVSVGADQGLKRGTWLVIGLELGLLVQVSVVALGLAPILVSNPFAFLIIKLLGIGYLIYLGLRLLLQQGTPALESTSNATTHSNLMLLVRGFWVNGTNFKSLIFLLALIPHFLSPKNPIVVQYFTIIGMMITVDFIVMTLYAKLGVALVTKLQSPRNRILLNRIIGSLFLCIAAVLALLRTSNHT